MKKIKVVFLVLALFLGSISANFWHVSANVRTMDFAVDWDDNSNQDGMRPALLNIILLANGSPFTSFLLNSGNEWKHSIFDFPTYEENEKIDYSIIVLDDTSNYKHTFSITEGDANWGTFVINSRHTPEKVNKSVFIEWHDNINQDNKRPPELSVDLLANGNKISSFILTKDNNWSAETLVDKYANGFEINYSVISPQITDYGIPIQSNSPNTFTLQYHHTPEQITKTVSLEWDDGNNQDLKRPFQVLVHLRANGVSSTFLTLNEFNNWTASALVDKYSNGFELDYTADSYTIQDYTSTLTNITSSTFTFQNTYVPEKVSKTITLDWNDGNDQDGKRPQEVAVVLKADGILHSTYLLTSSNGWTSAFSVDKFKNGVEIDYTFEGYNVQSYTSNVNTSLLNSVRIINSYTPETTNIEVNTIWNDSNNQDGKRPLSIDVPILANGIQVGISTISESNDWKISSDYPKYSNGVKITYSIGSFLIPEYGITTKRNSNSFTIENSYTTMKTPLSVTHIWDDTNNQDGKRPSSIDLYILENGTLYSTFTLNEVNAWQMSDTLPKYSQGKEIKYTISAQSITDYTSNYLISPNNDFLITSSHIPETIQFTLNSEWNDNSNQDGKRPNSIELQVLANGTHYEYFKLSTLNKWTYKKDLPRFDKGLEIKYTFVNEAIEDYTIEYTNSDNSTFKVKASHNPETIELTYNTLWQDSDNSKGLRPNVHQVEVYGNGKLLGTYSLTELSKWSITVRNLDKYQNGTLIEYSIKPLQLFNYTVTDKGYKLSETQIITENEILPGTGFSSLSTYYFLITITLGFSLILIKSKESDI